ncbi:MAG: MarR family winged helix-turn-helix transcriptional regulator [Phenylobacterium sp.]
MATDTDYTRKAGGAAVGGRLRRLSEWIDGDSGRIYATLGVRFEQRWFGVLNQLSLRGEVAVGELAATLRITHASISQTRQSLEAAGLIDARPDPKDGRRRQLRLTAAGKDLVARLSPLWRALDDAAQELNDEAGDAAAALDRLDDALAQRSWFERVTARLPSLES